MIGSHTRGGKHYSIGYDPYDTLMALCCNYCDFYVSRFDVSPTKGGFRWPQMSHRMKRHIRDKHDINLYKRQTPNQKG